MTAVDTNVVVRFLVADHRNQAKLARRLFTNEQVYISRSVLLEVAWVLRSTYLASPDRVVETLSKLAGLDNVVLEERERVLDALDLAAEGMDVADALHVTASPDMSDFVTFDKALVRSAKRAKSVPVKVRELR